MLSKTKVKINSSLFFVSSLLLMGLLIAYYIFQVNSLAREKYLFDDYQQRKVQFSRTNETLAINFSKNNSLANADKYLSDQMFEKAKNIKYIQIFEDQIVRR